MPSHACLLVRMSGLADSLAGVMEGGWSLGVKLIPLFITRESSYCFQRVLAITILSVCLSVCHTGGSVKNGAS